VAGRRPAARITTSVSVRVPAALRVLFVGDVQTTVCHYLRHFTGRSAARTCRRAGPPGPLVLSSLVKRAVDPITQRVCGLVGERLVQVAQDDAHQKVLLARPGPEASDR